MENPLDGALWLEANCPRLGKNDGRDFNRADWDQLLGHCQAVLDVPAICFSEELMKAYPEAKVILTSRDEDKWVRSMRALYHSMEAPSRKLKLRWNEVIGGEWMWCGRAIDQFCIRFYGPDPDVSARQVFREQRELVRNLCARSPERLLEWQVQDGWEPLCQFLGEPVPGVEFPNINDSKGYWERVEKNNALMGRDWRARKILWALDHWALSLTGLGLAAATIAQFLYGIWSW